MTIVADELLLVDRSMISSVVVGAGGSGGNIRASATSMVSRDSTLSSSALSGNGGNLAIATQGATVVESSRISAEVLTGRGDGGNIDFSTGALALRNSAISANAYGGRGGNILIGSPNVLRNPASTVTASSQLGIDGTVSFSSPAADLSGALFSVSSSFLDTNAVLAARCVGPNEGARTRLAMRLFDADHRVESGFLFPQGSTGVARSLALAALLPLSPAILLPQP